jgi:hypothetical protein
MRRLELLSPLCAISLLLAACSGAASKSETPNSGGNGEASEAASTDRGDAGGGGGGGGANGSVRYRISGDYTKSGELPFVPVTLSLYADGGWVAWFADQAGGTDNIIQLNTNPDTTIVNFGNSEIAIIGTKDTGCTFDFTKNDSGGLAGSFECHEAVGVSNADGTELHVDMSGEWDAHP